MYQKPFPCPNAYMDFWYQKGRYSKHIHALSNIKTSIDDTEPEMCSRIINKRKKHSEKLLLQQKTSKANYILITRAKSKKAANSTPSSSIYSRAESPRENNYLNSIKPIPTYTDVDIYSSTNSNSQPPKTQSTLLPSSLYKHDYLTELTFADKKSEDTSPQKSPQFKISKKGTFQDIIAFAHSNLDSIQSN